MLQVAISLLLLIGAGLFVRSLQHVHGVRLGFDPGALDGTFGTGVQDAVWAFQELQGLDGKDVTGEVTPELWDKMQDPLVVAPRDATTAAIR